MSLALLNQLAVSETGNAGDFSSPLDAVFNPPADDAAANQGAEGDDQASLEDAGADGAEEEIYGEEGDEGEGDEQPQTRKKKPEQDGTVTVKHRGQEFQVPAAMAGLVQALQHDHLEATRKITELSEANKATQPEKPAVDHEKAQASRAAALKRYDKALWEAIDTHDGEGITEQILKITDARHGAVMEDQGQQIAALTSQITELRGLLYGTMGDAVTENAMAKAISEDLPMMGHEAGAVTVDQVLPVFKALKANANGGRQSDREIYLIALGKVLSQPKKPGPKTRKPETQTDDNPIVDFGRPAAPNRTAPSGSGRPASTTHSNPLRPITGTRWDPDKF